MKNHVTINKNNYNPSKSGEAGDPISLTVPDKALTPRQILERHTSNKGLTGYQPHYQDENDINLNLPDIFKLDQMERLELAKDLELENETRAQEIIDRRQERAKKAAKASKKAKEEAEKEKATPPVKNSGPEDKTNVREAT